MEGASIRRRRECLRCGRRFTTYEKVEETPFLVVKKDGRREAFDRQKILRGVLTACEKRPVPIARVEELVDRVETAIRHRYEEEVPSSAIGEAVMAELRALDEVAYIRFASVYRQFTDIARFREEIERLGGGTVADTIDLIVAALNEALAERWGRPRRLEEIRPLFGPPDDELIRRELDGWPPEAVAEVVERYYAAYRRGHREGARLFPGIVEVLRALVAGGLRLGLLTNKSRRAAAITLEELGLAEFFPVVVSGNDAPPKPDPRGLEGLVAALGARPETAAMVGDGPGDVLVARRAGVLAVKVLWGRTHAASEADGADLVVTEPPELLALLGR
jgi:transcriptional repressor NrdR